MQPSSAHKGDSDADDNRHDRHSRVESPLFNEVVTDGSFAAQGGQNQAGGGNSPHSPIIDEAGDDVVVVAAATPTPVKQLTILGIVLLSEAMSASTLFPFVGLYVGHLMNIPVNETGHISGLVVGIFTFGQLLSASLWGHLSDAYGRKVPMIIGLSAGSVACFLFGISPNFVFCCIFRLIHGFFNGNVMIAKTIIADITDSTNEAKGFAVMSLTWGLGTLLGPAAGGALYDPLQNKRMAWLGVEEGSFLARYPAFLPSVFLSLYAAFATVVCVFFLKESNPHTKSVITILPQVVQKKLIGCFPCLSRGSTCGDAKSENPHQRHAHDVVITTVDAADKDGNEDMGHNEAEDHHSGGGSVPAVSADNPAKDPSAEDASTEDRPSITFTEAVKTPLIRRIIILVVTLGTSDTAYEEILPLWAIATLSVGGLELFADDVSSIIISYSVPTIVANVIFDRVCKRFPDHLLLHRLCSIFVTVSTVLIPVGSMIGGGSGFWYVIVVGMLRQVALSWLYGLVSMFTARCAPPGCVGALFGITQSASCLARCIIPVVITPIFAWSISEKRSSRPFPTNYFFVFILCSVLTLIAGFLTYYIDFRDRAVRGRGANGSSQGGVHVATVAEVGGEEDGSHGDEHCSASHVSDHESDRRSRRGRRRVVRSHHRRHSAPSTLYGDDESERSWYSDGDESIGSVDSDRSVLRDMTAASYVSGVAPLNASSAQGAALAVEQLHREEMAHEHAVRQRRRGRRTRRLSPTALQMEDRRQMGDDTAEADEELPV